MQFNCSLPCFLLTVALTALVALPLAAQDIGLPATPAKKGGDSSVMDRTPRDLRRHLFDRPATPHSSSIRKAASRLLPDLTAFSTDQIRPLPVQDSERSYAFPAMKRLQNGSVALVYRERGEPSRLLFTQTMDGGETWEQPTVVAIGSGVGIDLAYLRVTETPFGRVLVSDESMFGTNRLFYSDDDGESWSETPLNDAVVTRREDWPGRCGQPDGNNGWLDGPGFNTEPVVGPVGNSVWHAFSDLAEGNVGYYTSEDGVTWSEDPNILIENPQSDSFYVYLQDIVSVGTDSYVAAFMRVSRDESCFATTLLSRSLDGGETWSTLEQLDTDSLTTVLGRMASGEDGSVWYVFQDAYFDLYVGDGRFPESDVFYVTSTDTGTTWSEPEQLTRFIGTDIQPQIALTATGPLTVFTSNRYTPGDWSNQYDLMYHAGGTRLWIGSPTNAEEDAGTTPPVVLLAHYGKQRMVTSRESATVWAQVEDDEGIRNVWVKHQTPDGGIRVVDLHKAVIQPGDVYPYDMDENQLWKGSIGSIALGEIVDYEVWAQDSDGNLTYSDHFRSRNAGWTQLVPARFYSQPMHDTGGVCLALSSAIQEEYGSDWWLDRITPRSGYLGRYAFDDGWTATGVLDWPCKQADHGNRYLFEGAFMVGLRSVNGSEDFRVIGYTNSVGWSQTRAPVAYSGWSDQDFRLEYEDTGDYGVAVTQESHQFAGEGAEDVVFLEYTVVNTGAAGTLEDVEVALYIDADIGNAYDELVEYDITADVLYMFDDGQDEGCDCGPGTVAMAIVSGQKPDYVNITSPNWGNDWEIGIDPTLTAGDPVGPRDVRGTLGIGVDEFRPGDTVKVAFAVIMATDRTELLLTKLPRARQVYSERAGIENQPPVSARLVSPPAYAEIWAGSPDEPGADPSGFLDTEFVWEAVGKTRTQSVTYELQMGASAEFGTPLRAEAGRATKLSGAFAQSDVVAELEAVGVSVLDSTLFYARVVASEGDLMTYGPTLPLVIFHGNLCSQVVCAAIDPEFGVPDRYALYPNYPNPFNPSTVIAFDLPAMGEVTLNVFDLLGRKVARLEQDMLPAGRHVYRWDASNVASGVYLYRLNAGDYVAERTLILAK